MRTSTAFAAVCLALSIAMSTNVRAADDRLDAAVDAFNAEDYAAARDRFSALADDGNGDAQFFLGIMRLEGLDGPIDIPAGRAWLRRAGEQGHAPAQFRLAEMFRLGTGAPAPDRAQAAAWYLRAAEGGWFAAQMAVARMYAAGEGIPQDQVEALKWYDIAAEMGLDPYTADRDALAATMDDAAIAEAARRARAWLAVHRRWDSDSIAATAATAGK